MKQDEFFLEGEGDNYFTRNEGRKVNMTYDICMRFLEQYGVAPKRALDIGCAKGHLLNRVYQKYKCDAHGIEPSALAIQEGKKQFPYLSLLQGVSHDLSAFKTGFFDFVICNFVFHWIDRNYLLASIAEADRVLASGGFMILSDFEPGTPRKRHYRNEEKIFTYKQRYREIFEASNLYIVLEKIVFNHDEENFSRIGSDNAGSVCLLKKDININYPLA